MQTLKHTNEQLVIKDAILEDQLNEEAKKRKRKSFCKYTSLKKWNGDW